MSISMVDEALRLRNMGLSVIPCGRDKVPIGKWKEYQERFASEDEIRSWFSRTPDANIGIVTGKLSGIAVIDCDSQDAIISFRSIYKGDTPTVKTPRGTHFYFKHIEGVSNTVKVKGIDLDVRGEGGYVVAPPSINKEGVAYRWLKDIDSFALDSIDFGFLYKGGVSTGGNNMSTRFNNCPQVSTFYQEGRRDNDLFHAANCLIKGHAEPEFVRQTLEMLAHSCNPPYPEKDIEAKISSAMERVRKRERNLTAEVEEYILSTSGNFLSTDCEKCLQLSTREEKKNLSMILKRLCDKNVIERYGSRNGSWRKVENEIEVIDWRNASDEEYPIEWPLGIRQLVKMYPKSIAIIAGAPNAGKTSFFIELIRLNEKKYGDDMLYANSEMSAAELKLRLMAYPPDMQKYCTWNFTAIERADNFADVIRPNGFNIIDYLEIYDEFWKIGGQIKDIHKRLDKGVAIIAIQKNASTGKQINDYGRGGQITLEKPRLYLAMDRGKVKIVKAKIWRNSDRNPNGMTRRFKLVGGWKWLPEDAWMSEEEEEKKQRVSSYSAVVNSVDPDFIDEEE